MTIEERAEKAVELKHNGHNCAQAVIGACSDFVDGDTEMMLKMTSGYAAGMGCMESTCGALNGAVMIAGILTDGKGTARTAAKLLKNFDQKSGATICKDLKGVETGKVLCPCDDCVRNAVMCLGEEFNGLT